MPARHSIRGRSVAALLAIVVLACAAMSASTAVATYEPVPYEEFASRVQRALDVVRDRSASIGEAEVAREVSREVADLLPGFELVEVDGRAVAADESVARALAEELGRAATAQERQLTAEDLTRHLSSLSQAVSSGLGDPPREDREALEGLVTPPSPQQELMAELMRRILAWLGELLAGLDFSGAEGGALIVNAVLLLLAAVVLGLALWLVVRIVRFRRGRAEKSGEEYSLEGPVVEAARDLPEDAVALAERLAERGEYREAVRALFGDAARRLVRHGVVRQTKTVTNGELVRIVASQASALVAPIRALAVEFDTAWYGHIDPGREGFERCKAEHSRLLAGLGAGNEETL
ncbi:MAG: hypothetical protein Kow0056_07420 [Coriobacteriia bacterium]